MGTRKAKWNSINFTQEGGVYISPSSSTEEAFMELASFLFELYKKDKQSHELQEPADDWRFVFFLHNNIIK